MSLPDAIKVARRLWWILLVGPIAGVLAALIICETITPKYQATATILIEQRESSGSQTYQDLLAAQQRTSTYSHLITAGPVLDEAARRLNMPGGSAALKRKISVDPVTDTQLVAVSASDLSAERAATIANMISVVFIEQNNQEITSSSGNGLQEIQQRLDEIKQQIDDNSDQIATLQSTPNPNASDLSRIAALQEQLSQSQSAYGSLLETQQRKVLAQTQIGATARVVDPATAPSSPIKPRLGLDVMLGGLLGLLVATTATLLIGYFDSSIRTSADLRRVTGTGPLASIPFAPSLDLQALPRQSQSAILESVRALRTNLLYAMRGRDIKVIVVTSSRASEGKSTVAANLAVALAQSEQRVVLVDADLRRSGLRHMLAKSDGSGGLAELLQDVEIVVTSVRQETQVPGLRLLANGMSPEGQADELESPRMADIVTAVKEDADVVLIDTPPLSTSDPVILAGIADAVLLVLGAGGSRADDLTSALEQIGLTGKPIVGIVLNRVEAGDSHNVYQERSEPDLEGNTGPLPARATLSTFTSRAMRLLRSRPWRSA
jgi:capsular exopolysaccharide synthesis family protein